MRRRPSSRSWALVLYAALGACGPSPKTAPAPVAAQVSSLPGSACFEPATSLDARFVGEWELVEGNTNIQYTITQKGRQLCLAAHAVNTSEWYEVSDLNWDGKVLSVTFLAPSNKWRTESRLTISDGNRIRDEFTTKHTPKGVALTEVWTRR
jgi:hypothetical protein